MVVAHAYVVNIRDGDEVLEGATSVRIDRSDPVFGNPFRQRGRGDLNERMRVLALHEQHVHADLKKEGPIFQALQHLASRVFQGETIALKCWCSPLPCHGDLLARAINEMAREMVASSDALRHTENEQQIQKAINNV